MDPLELHPEERPSRQVQVRSSRWLVLVICFGAVLALVPLWAPLTLAAWVATLARPLNNRLTRKLGGRNRAAAVMTVLLVIAVLVPLIALTVPLVSSGIALVRQLLASPSGAAALTSLASSDDGAEKSTNLLQTFNVQNMIAIARQHGASAWNALTVVAGAATTWVVGSFVFVLGVHQFLENGSRIHDWLLEHAPIPRAHFQRLANAFNETGRGLFVGTGLTALLQGVVAGIGYVALGIDQALVLGAMTVVVSLIPTGGSALVWLPVTIGLAVGGRPVGAAVMFAVGMIVSTADNLVRPALSRYGKLEMPTYLLLVAALGGIAFFGAGGLLLGPLLVRLAMEALEIMREQREAS